MEGLEEDKREKPFHIVFQVFAIPHQLPCFLFAVIISFNRSTQPEWHGFMVPARVKQDESHQTIALASLALLVVTEIYFDMTHTNTHTHHPTSTSHPTMFNTSAIVPYVSYMCFAWASHLRHTVRPSVCRCSSGEIVRRMTLPFCAMPQFCDIICPKCKINSCIRSGKCKIEFFLFKTRKHTT